MNEEVELKVCKGCDAPLPYKPKVKSFFKKDNENEYDFSIKVYEKSTSSE